VGLACLSHCPNSGARPRPPPLLQPAACTAGVHRLQPLFKRTEVRDNPPFLPSRPATTAFAPPTPPSAPHPAVRPSPVPASFSPPLTPSTPPQAPHRCREPLRPPCQSLQLLLRATTVTPHRSDCTAMGSPIPVSTPSFNLENQPPRSRLAIKVYFKELNKASP
jgi:hypothetical protein